jgi:hypothetical protein
MRIAQTQRVMLLLLVSVVTPITAQAQKIAIGKYQTEEAFDKVFLAALRATPLVKFAVKSSDKDQGTIQAVRAAKGSAAGREFASLFVVVRREEKNVVVEATFTRNPGFIGGGSPDQWAKQFGDELKSELQDLTISVTKR